MLLSSRAAKSIQSVVVESIVHRYDFHVKLRLQKDDASSRGSMTSPCPCADNEAPMSPVKATRWSI